MLFAMEESSQITARERFARGLTGCSAKGIWIARDALYTNYQTRKEQQSGYFATQHPKTQTPSRPLPPSLALISHPSSHQHPESPGPKQILEGTLVDRLAILAVRLSVNVLNETSSSPSSPASSFCTEIPSRTDQPRGVPRFQG